MAATHKLIIINSRWGDEGPNEEDCDCEIGKDHY